MLRRERVVAAVFLAAAAGVLLAGAAMTRAGVSKVRAEAFMSSWAAKGDEPEAPAWEAARLAAAEAVAWYPVANGDYEDRLGRVYLWRHFRHDFGAAGARDSREQAKAAFMRALSQRPNSPGTQVRLAHTYLYLLQLDAPLARAIGSARQRGPWQLAVNRELAEVGLVAWPSLAPAQRAQVRDAFCAVVAAGAADLEGLQDLALGVGEKASECPSST